MSSRTFKVTKVSFGGSSKKHSTIAGKTVVASTPASAAAKAFNSSCSANKITKKCNSTISLEDITEQGTNAGKKYAYKITRVFSPKTVKIGGKEVVFKYETIVTSIKK